MDSILKPVGTTGGLEQTGDVFTLRLKKILELLWAEQMGGGCCFGPNWQGWWKVGELGAHFGRTSSVFAACREVGHERKGMKEIADMGHWECGQAFHGWAGKTGYKYVLEGGTVVAESELQTYEMPPDGGAQVAEH